MRNNFCFFSNKNVYTFTVSNGLTITGTCETACTPSPVTITTGTTCSSTIFGNTLSFGVKSATFDGFLIIMALIGINLF